MHEMLLHHRRRSTEVLSPRRPHHLLFRCPVDVVAHQKKGLMSLQDPVVLRKVLQNLLLLRTEFMA